MVQANRFSEKRVKRGFVWCLADFPFQRQNEGWKPASVFALWSIRGEGQSELQPRQQKTVFLPSQSLVSTPAGDLGVKRPQQSAGVCSFSDHTCRTLCRWAAVRREPALILQSADHKVFKTAFLQPSWTDWVRRKIYQNKTQCKHFGECSASGLIRKDVYWPSSPLVGRQTFHHKTGRCHNKYFSVTQISCAAFVKNVLGHQNKRPECHPFPPYPWFCWETPKQP